MGRTKPPPRAPATDRALGGYLELSNRPLHILAFLAPLIVLYEIGSVRYLTDSARGVIGDVRARGIISGFFEGLGATGLFLPGLVIVTVLLARHVLRNDDWRLRPAVLAGMAVETVLWTAPLLVMSLLIQHAATAAAPIADLGSLNWQARLTISIGAGLYEELLFRMVGILLLHMVFVDICRVSEAHGRLIAVVLQAVAFAVYHDLSSGAGIEWSRAVFFFAAGVFFGVLFIVRGFGLVVGTHALYDVLVLVLFRGS